MARLLLLCLVLCVPLLKGQAQTHKNRVLSIPAENYNQPLLSPWVGGMNAPQFSMGDFNNDGLDDLLIFDRVGDKVLTYLNKGGNSDTTFVYAPQYETIFPDDLTQYAILRDYNNDGIPDLFTRAVYYMGNAYVGSRAFKGSYQNNVLRFNLVTPLLTYTDGIFENINIYTSVDDIPVLADVNHDGDLDVLTYGLSGALIQYYENLTVENQATGKFAYDSLKFQVVQGCWGNFAEGFNNSILLNYGCKGGLFEPGENGEESRDGAHAIYGVDYDNDADLDLIMGNNAYSKMFLLKNCGDTTYAEICSYDSTFPACNTPVDLPFFPAAYEANVNNDHLKDVIIAPNARVGASDVKNVFYYRHTGNPACPYNFETDSFLTGDIIDLGTDSRPAFFDFDGDGLLDIIVGNYGYFRPFQTYRSALAIYRNVGTSTNPSFKRLTDDYNTFSSLNIVGKRPAFGDLDGDGLQDMILGDITGILHFFKNSGTSQASFPTITVNKYFNIDVGDESIPFVYDLNGDSLNDLLVGSKNGKISYYWNFGTSSSPMFHVDSVNSFLGGISVNEPGYIQGYSSPFVYKSSDGNTRLLSGSLTGRVYEYLVDDTKLRGGTFQMLDSNLIGFQVGSKSTIAVADIDNDGHLEYLLGNSRGGLLFYSDTVWDNSTSPVAINKVNRETTWLTLYPNPAKNTVTCNVAAQNTPPLKAEVLSLLGQSLACPYQTYNKDVVLDVSQLSAGVYYVALYYPQQRYTAKLLIEH